MVHTIRLAIHHTIAIVFSSPSYYQMDTLFPFIIKDIDTILHKIVNQMDPLLPSSSVSDETFGRYVDRKSRPNMGLNWKIEG